MYVWYLLKSRLWLKSVFTALDAAIEKPTTITPASTRLKPDLISVSKSLALDYLGARETPQTFPEQYPRRVTQKQATHATGSCLGLNLTTLANGQPERDNGVSLHEEIAGLAA